MSGSFGPIHENLPQCGYYRIRPRKGEPGDAVAIWHDGVELRALRAGRPVDAFSVWTWCCRHPVSHEAYVAVAERGEPWPDQVPELAGIGHNSGDFVVLGAEAGPRRTLGAGACPGPVEPASDLPELVALDALLAQGPAQRQDARREPAQLLGDTTRLWHQASAWLGQRKTLATQAEADRAANFAHAFAQLEKAAEDARVAEKKPVLDQGRAIDRRWKGVLVAAEDARKHMKRLVEGFLLARLEDLEFSHGFGPIPESELPRAGTLGRRIGLRLQHSVSIIDRKSFLEAYRADERVWASEGVEKALLALAEADLVAGRSVPGALLIEQRVAV